MNLHGIASAAIGAVNPNQPAIVRASAGYTTADDGSRIPAYGPPVAMVAQVQALTTRDFAQLDNLNVAGSTHKVYVSDPINGVIRSTNKGGDLIVVGEQTYLVTAVLEQWPDYTCASVTLQNAG